jgi:hypothetical protein
MSKRNVVPTEYDWEKIVAESFPSISEYFQVKVSCVFLVFPFTHCRLQGATVTEYLIGQDIVSVRDNPLLFLVESLLEESLLEESRRINKGK